MIKALIMGIVAVMLWSMNVIMSSLLAGHIAPIVITFSRWLVAGLVLLPFVWHEIPKIKTLHRNDWFIVVVQASLSVVLCNTFVYQAGHTAKAIDMALMGATAPIFMAVFSTLILHTKNTIRQMVGYSFALVGVFILLLHGNLENISTLHFAVGDVWMILSAICFALYSILMAFKPAQVSQTLFLTLCAVVGCILMAPFAAWHMLESGLSAFTMPHMSAIVFMGIFQSVVAFTAWNYCVMRIGNTRAGLLFYCKPIFSCITAYFLWGDSIQTSQALGACLVFAGIIYAAVEKQTNTHTLANA